MCVCGWGGGVVVRVCQWVYVCAWVHTHPHEGFLICQVRVIYFIIPILHEDLCLDLYSEIMC